MALERESARKASAAAADSSTIEQAVAAAGTNNPQLAGRGPGGGDPLLGELRRGGILKLLVLHLLTEGPSYGNQLIDRIAQLTGGWLAVNPNTMYPLLRSLEAEKLITGEWEHPERRSRRYYLLTDLGVKNRQELLKQVQPMLETVAAGIENIRAELFDG